MTQIELETARPHEAYLASFRDRAPALAKREPEWLSTMRQQAIEAFADRGFPTVRDEEWRFTNIAPLTRIPFVPARPDSIHCAVELVQSTWWDDPVAARLVFINGHYSPQFSVLSNAARGVEVGNLSAAVGRGESWLQTFLGHAGDVRREPFAALNSALWEDGAYVRIPKSVEVPEPIHIVYISATQSEPLVSYPRTLVVAEPGSQATVIESYVGLKGDDAGTSFSNAVSEIVVGEDAAVGHYQLQNVNHGSFHIGAVEVFQGRSSRFTSCAIAAGAALARNDVNAVLDGEGGECNLNGLYLATGRQHVDNHTSIEHARPHCASRQHYNGILDGQAAGVFSGRIMVRPDAQKTDAIQKNRNLLLSPDATIDTKPLLEIFADDVRCTHGATIGQLDAESLFYLRSRGIGKAEARELLVYAFAGEILDRIKPAAVRAWADRELRMRLSKDSGQ
jgi:Fe-S cluster assembly protein SufD